MASTRTQFWISPRADLWYVQQVVGDRHVSLSTHFKKKQAIKAGIKAAKASKPSELYIQNRKGKIKDRRTYGNDPFPPEG